MSRFTLFTIVFTCVFFSLPTQAMEDGEIVVAPASFHLMKCGESHCFRHISQRLRFPMRMTYKNEEGYKVYFSEIEELRKLPDGEAAILEASLMYVDDPERGGRYYLRATSYFSGEGASPLPQLDVNFRSFAEINELVLNGAGERVIDQSLYVPQLLLDPELGKKQLESVIQQLPSSR